MSIVKTFRTIPEMFDVVTKEFQNIVRPLYLRKVKDRYEGIKYSEFRTLVQKFVHGLASIGVQKGDKVAIISENRPEWVVSDMAVLILGAITVPIYPSSTAKQIEYIFADAGVKYSVVSNQLQLNKVNKISDNLPLLKKVIIMNEKYDLQENVLNFSEILTAGENWGKSNPDFFEKNIYSRTPDEICTIIYTSGTTGNPKGVMLSNDNFVSQTINLAKVVDFSEKDTLLSFLPLSHVFERTGNYFSFSCGCSTAFAESIDTVSKNMLEINPTIIITVPRLFERIYARIMKTIESSSNFKQKIFNWAIGIGKEFSIAKKKGYISPILKSKFLLADRLVFAKLKEKTGGKIRFFISGGAALRKELGTFFESIGLLILEGYGLTESSPVISSNRVDAYRFGSVGIPLPETEVKIANDGEIIVRGPNIMKGYFNDPEHTKESIDEEGWLHTGDIGCFDTEGFLHITDRKKHLFVSSGGKNIAPQPIENLFLSSKYIDQFILIGDRRQFLSAIIVPDFDAIKEHADMKNIGYNNLTDLTNNDEIKRLIESELGIIQQDLANYEKVRRFVLLDRPLTLEDGEITPSLKVKRKVIEEKYADIIEGMYK